MVYVLTSHAETNDITSFNSVIGAEPKVVSLIQKHIWNCHFKFYNLLFVLIVVKILSSKL